MIKGKGFVMMAAMIMPCTDTMKSSWHYSRKRKTKRRANLPLVVAEGGKCKKSQTKKVIIVGKINDLTLFCSSIFVHLRGREKVQ